MKFLSTFLILLVATPSQSAIPRNSLSQDQELRSVLEALRLPRKNRLVMLKNKSEAVERLYKVAVDEKQPLQMRWRSITSMGEMSPIKAGPYLEKLAVRKEWYLRNAAMIAISHADRPTVMKWAQHLLEDPSLMVRTSAVNAIKKIRGVELQDLLWKKINSKENFHRGKSLWIRKHIADALASLTYKGDEKKFMRLLLDRDHRLHPYAILGLRKNTGKTLAVGQGVPERRQAWIQYFKESKVN